MSGNCQISSCLVHGLLFGIKVQEVQEIIRDLRITRVPLAPPQIAGLLNLRGQIITAIDLRRCLDFPERLPDQVPINLILRTDAGLVSLLVDEVGAVLDVGEDALEAPLPTMRGRLREVIRETYKLSGSLLLVLDTRRLVAEASVLVTSPGLFITTGSRPGGDSGAALSGGRR